MKKLFFILLTTIFSFHFADAQDVNLDSINAGFKGVFTVQGGQFYYTFYKVPKKGSKNMSDLVLLSYNGDLVPIKRTSLEVSKGTNVVASSFNGTNYFLVLADRDKKTISSALVNLEGKIVKKTDADNTSSAMFNSENYPKIFSIMPDAFVKITPVHEKKRSGYKMERFDRDLNIQWTKTFLPETGSWSITDAYPVMEKLTLIRKEGDDADKLNASLQVVQVDQGELMLNTELKDNASYGVPLTFKVNDDLPTIAGVYYNNGSTGTQPDGLFAAICGPAGDMQRFAKVPWDKIYSSLSGSLSADLTKGKVHLLLEDVAKRPGGYVLICEAYSIAPAGKNTDFKIGDFVFIGLTESGDFDYVHQFHKPVIDLVLKGDEPAKMNSHSVAEKVYDKHFFSFRVAKSMRDAGIMYSNGDTATGLSFISMKDSTFATNALPPMPGKPASSYKQAAVIDLNDDDNDITSMLGLMPTLRTQKMFMYEYERPKLIMRMMPN